jgi:leucyl/phenylalanyl-tRNA---protein transferase
MKRLRWLAPGDPPSGFPEVTDALDDPAGLLAGGGDLSAERLVEAYRRGIFPWYSTGQPVLWWSPDPREVLFPGEFHVSRSLRRDLRRGRYRITENLAFPQVVRACAEPRAAQAGTVTGTWITPEMQAAYCTLRDLGVAHSIEVWSGDALVGGMYGVRSGPVFCGESMFSREANASKAALEWLARTAPERGIRLIDCQMPSPHLRSLGSRPLPRAQFLKWLEGDAPDRFN